MEKQRKIDLMRRWSLITAILIALFWTIWYLTKSSVPVTNSIKMTPNWTLEIPFGISRWWDILIGPIWSIVLIPLLTSEKFKKDKDLVVGLVVGLGSGLIIGPNSGLIIGLAIGIIIAWGLSLIIGLGFGLIDLGSGLSSSLAVSFNLYFGLIGLGFGLGFGLIFGLAIGLTIALGFNLIIALGLGLVRFGK